VRVGKDALLTQPCAQFRAEEVATAKVKEYGLENKIERIDQSITTYFDVSTKVWGTEPSGKLCACVFMLR